MSDIQTNVKVSGKNINGTLKHLTEGDIAEFWGDGYFVALQFDNIPEGATVKVGPYPSAGSGLVELDEDRNGVFKITNKNTQKFKVVTSKGSESITDTYSLRGLTLLD